ncbi:aspartic peptidase domain-containing protein [Lasiosphaeria miniovina]|uniref:Aspartic peptidase domain-containing protein n=1 Tax=Lasiosphaeria miniovina TaxID=1954250 RepID=A0AA40A6N3_9PEZI|nr:aspartic peptidase domain-containing protein [Lasiosphaeria miniovina]KAK0710205.1 aspartic peptidase domain-containing protein [Lasiosphaeria miniovina]
MTSTLVYSMWLNDLAASTGNILFGGIDTAKFTGPLTRLQLYPTKSPSTINEFAVKLTSVTAYSKSGSDKLGSTSFPASVVLDSGTTLSFLPSDLVSQIYKEAGVAVDSDSGTPVVPYSYARGGGSFAFGFGGANGATINVAMSELVLPVVGNFTQGPNKGQDACEFGIRAVSSSSDALVLGDTFLSSAFVIYDLVNDEVALAQTKFNVTDSNIVAFGSLSATVPSSTPAPSQAQIADGVVTASPTSYAAASAFAVTSAGARGVRGAGGEAAGVMMAVLVAVGARVLSSIIL